MRTGPTLGRDASVGRQAHRKMSRHAQPDARAALQRRQRTRILDATLSIASVAGYADLSVRSILALAEVHRRTFNAMFLDKEDAFLALYQQLLDELAEHLADAYDPDAAPSDRVIGCLDAVVAFLLADPVRAELVLLEVHAAGAKAVGLQRSVLDVLVDRTAKMLAEDGDDDGGWVQLEAEFAIGAVHDALRTWLHRGELGRLPDVLSDLARTAFPMLAPQAARPGVN